MQTIRKTIMTIFLIGIMFAALFVGIAVRNTQASSCSVWYQCSITQYFGQRTEYGGEHGVDLWTHGLPVTAIRSGTITFVHQECWEWPCIIDITWKLDYPSHAGGSRYMYVQIATSSVHVGQHVADWDKLGMSGNFIEFGLTPDWAYGVSGWHWGINPQFLL